MTWSKNLRRRRLFHQTHPLVGVRSEAWFAWGCTALIAFLSYCGAQLGLMALLWTSGYFRGVWGWHVLEVLSALILLSAFVAIRWFVVHVESCSMAKRLLASR